MRIVVLVKPVPDPAAAAERLGGVETVRVSVVACMGTPYTEGALPELCRDTTRRALCNTRVRVSGRDTEDARKTPAQREVVHVDAAHGRRMMRLVRGVRCDGAHAAAQAGCAPRRDRRVPQMGGCSQADDA